MGFALTFTEGLTGFTLTVGTTFEINGSATISPANLNGSTATSCFIPPIITPAANGKSLYTSPLVLIACSAPNNNDAAISGTIAGACNTPVMNLTAGSFSLISGVGRRNVGALIPALIARCASAASMALR